MTDTKAVLFICPDFFDYKKQITQELTKRYSKVISVSDRPACSSVSKALIKYHAPFYSSYISKKYSNDILQEISEDLLLITDVIIIKGTCILPSFIDMIRACKNDIRIVCYSWDSISNIKTFKALASKADSSFTFDLKDSFDYDINYLPLFYVEQEHTANQIKKSSIENLDGSFDYSFVGSYHGDRIRLLMRYLTLRPQSRNFIKIYFQSYLQYIFYFILDSAVRSSPKNWVTFRPILREELAEITDRSKNIIDIHHKGQTGLTMRTWETLNGGHRLVTTNPAILLHTTDEPLVVIDRDSGLEWTPAQCDEYRNDMQKLMPKFINSGILSLSLWVDVLLIKS